MWQANEQKANEEVRAEFLSRLADEQEHLKEQRSAVQNLLDKGAAPSERIREMVLDGMAEIDKRFKSSIDKLSSDLTTSQCDIQAQHAELRETSVAFRSEQRNDNSQLRTVVTQIEQKNWRAVFRAAGVGEEGLWSHRFIPRVFGVGLARRNFKVVSRDVHQLLVAAESHHGQSDSVRRQVRCHAGDSDEAPRHPGGRHRNATGGHRQGAETRQGRHCAHRRGAADHADHSEGR